MLYFLTVVGLLVINNLCSHNSVIIVIIVLYNSQMSQTLFVYYRADKSETATTERQLDLYIKQSSLCFLLYTGIVHDLEADIDPERPTQPTVRSYSPGLFQDGITSEV